MREIKYRAWHPGHPSDGENMKGIMIQWGGFELKAWFFTDNQSRLMQFTGLKDSKGTDIYEGDIVQYKNGDLSGYHKRIVVWNEERCAFKYNKQGRTKEETLSGKTATTPITQKRCGNHTIIGNIYENPELIDKN